MKIFKIMGWSSALCLSLITLQAQETNEVGQLKKQLQQMQDSFEKVTRAQQQQIEALTKKLDEFTKTQSAPSIAAPKTEEQKKLEAQLAAELSKDSATNSALTESALKKPWSASDPIRVLGSGSSYLNVSLDGLFAAGGSTATDIPSLQLGGHDPNQRGFTVQNVEAVFEGFVDPYFRGQANIVYQIDAEGASAVELEEAYAESLSLPGNLQLKAGQYFTEFGRLNPTHPHAWSFVDLPLVSGRFLGGDGLRNPGARLSWLMPTPFYSELFLSVQNSHGETAESFRNEHEGEPFLGRVNNVGRVKSFGDLLFTPRYATSFDLSDTQTLLLGASGAFGPNASGVDTDTQIFGVDLFWKWKPANHHGGFPFVSWQTEAMLRKYQAGAFSNIGDDTDSNGAIDNGEADLFGDGLIHNAPRETLTDYGFYSQLAYGFRKGWVANLRGEYVTRSNAAEYEKLYGDDSDRLARWRISPNLTWYPSEFSKLRLQYNYDHWQFSDTEHSIWLQLEFLLGSHGAHKF
ncbi:MAG: hypothetical protein ABIP76_05815 [Verrucomicrobiota bacterium]